MKGLTTWKTSPLKMYTVTMTRKKLKQITTSRRLLSLPSLQLCSFKKLSQNRCYKMKHFVFNALILLILEFQFWKFLRASAPTPPPPHHTHTHIHTHTHAHTHTHTHTHTQLRHCVKNVTGDKTLQYALFVSQLLILLMIIINKFIEQPFWQ